MLRRMLLGCVLVAALGVASVGLANKANAHGGCGYDGYYDGYATYYGYRNVYFGGVPRVYPSPYVAGYTYAPPVVVYPGGRRHHHRPYYPYRGRGGVTFAIGF